MMIEEEDWEDRQSDQTSLDDIRTRRHAYEFILDNLAEAGYFRVKLKGLNEFDKVIGGLCWALTASHEQVSIDLLFQENLSVGRRIKLAEDIVKSLRMIQCPYPLQAHQIQGGDYPALKPIIVWLTKRVAATRHDTSVRVRTFAELQFQKQSRQGEFDKDQEPSYVLEIAQKYKPVRKYRVDRKTYAEENAKEALVRAVLLEFGEKLSDNGSRLFDQSTVQDESGKPTVDKQFEDAQFESKYQAMMKTAMHEEEQRVEREKQIEAELLESRKAVEESRAVEHGDMPAPILKDRHKEILQAETEYKKTRSESDSRASISSNVSKTPNKSALYERAAEKLRAKIDKAKRKMEKAVQWERESEDRATETEEKVYAEQKKIKRALKEVAKLEDMEGELGHQEDLEVLRALVEENEQIKAEEHKFRASCKAQMKQMKSEIEQLKQRIDNLTKGDDNDDGNGNDNPERERMREIDKLYREISEKHRNLAAMLASSNQRVALLSRSVDDVPTRSELIQYERRFVELYEQLAVKLNENRRHVTTYNTLETTLELLEKEVSLLQSVNDTIKTSMKSKKGKAEFLQQFQGILTGLRTRLDQMKQQHEQANHELNAKELEFQRLITQQRTYFQAVKEFQYECDLNERLASLITSKN